MYITSYYIVQLLPYKWFFNEYVKKWKGEKKGGGVQSQIIRW